MKRRRRRLAFFVILALALSSTAFAGQTRRYSVIVNRPEVRQHIQRQLFDGQRLQVSRRLDPKNPPQGVTAQAARKALQTWNGFANLNFGVRGGNYVVSAGGNGQRWVVTDAHERSVSMEHFVARTGRRGIVVARGFIKGGRITWTRSHNERGKDAPSERNPGGR